MQEITVWTDCPSDLPSGYDYLPSGNAALTRAVKKSSDKVFVRMQKLSKRYPARSIGIWARSDLIDQERARLAATAAKRRANREKRQARDIENFKGCILDRFPNCPPEEAESIAYHACEVGSGRVGRSSVADDPVLFAVIAHIRHEHTDYERLLDDQPSDTPPWERSDHRRWARAEVQPAIQAVLDLWGDTEEQAAERAAREKQLIDKINNQRNK